MIDFHHGSQIKMHQPIRLTQVEKTDPILFITGPMLWEQELQLQEIQDINKSILTYTKPCIQDHQGKVMGETLVANKIVLLRLLLWGRDHAPKELIGLTSPLWIEDKASTFILGPNLNLHQIWLHLRIQNHLSLELNLLKYLSHFLLLWTNLIGIDLHRKEKGMKILKMEKISWSLYPLLDLWKKIGRFQSKKPLLTLLVPKLPVKSQRPTPSNWSAMSAKDNMIALSGFWATGILPHLKKLLATWRQSLLTLVRWQELRLRDPTPLKSQMLWAMDCSSLRTSGTRNHSRTMTPMCTTSFMARQIKEHLLFLLRNWFDLGTSLSAGTWQTVDILPTGSIQQEKLQPKLFTSPLASGSWPGRFWRLEKELCQSLLEGSTLDEINISIKCLEEMKKFNDFVENMVLLEEKKNTWWQDQNTQQFMAWWSPTRMLSDLSAIPRALDNSSPCSIFRDTLLPLDIPKIFYTNDYGASTVATIRTWSYCESQLLGLQCSPVSAVYVFHSRDFLWYVRIEWSSKSPAWVNAVCWRYATLMTFCFLFDDRWVSSLSHCPSLFASCFFPSSSSLLGSLLLPFSCPFSFFLFLCLFLVLAFRFFPLLCPSFLSFALPLLLLLLFWF